MPDAHTRSWNEVAGHLFGPMSPFMAGCYSAALAAAVIFIYRVTRLLIARMKRRLAVLEATRQSKATNGKPPPPPVKGSTKKRK